MMLFKLAVRNIQKSVKDFTIYFFTLVLGVTMFYLFNSMDSSAGVLSMSESKMEIVHMLNRLLGYVSVFVSVVLGCLIVYASRFLMKRRSKEFGTYLLLGMSRTNVTGVLLMETLLIGCLSFLIGIVLGVFGAQFMTLLVCQIFEVDMEQYRFAFSLKSVLKTMTFFGITFLIVILFQAAAVAKSKLIDLLNISRKSERIKARNLWVCMVLFVISVLILAAAYHTALTENPNLRLVQRAGRGIVLGCFGTFLLIYSFCGMMLKLLQSRKELYLKNLNMFIGRQLSAQVNTMIISMSIIALMLFFSIGLLSAGLSLNSALTDNLKERVPLDLNISMSRYISIEKEKETKGELSKTSILDFLNDYNYNTAEHLREYEEITMHFSGSTNSQEPVTVSRFLENAEEISMDYQMPAIGFSDYNRLAGLYHLEPVSLNDEEYAVIGNADKTTKLIDQGLSNGIDLTIGDKTLKPAFTKCQYGFIMMDAGNDETGVLIIPDALAKHLPVIERVLIGNFNTEDETEINDNYQQILAAFRAASDSGYWNEGGGYGISTKLDIYEASIGMGTIAIFIGIYLSIIFIITSAAILALKQLSESSDNRNRYDILRKIGTDVRMINQSLFLQIGIFFALPLVLAIIHSYFGLKFTDIILQSMGKERISSSAAITALVIVLIYGGYFLITYLCSKSIIKKNNSN